MSLQKKLSKACTAMSWTALCPVSKPSHSQLCNCLTCLGSKATLSHITVDNSENVNSPLEGKLWRISKKNWTQSWGGEGRRNLSGRSEITAKSWPVFVSHRIPSTLPLIFLQDLIAPHPIFTPPPPPTFSYPHFCQIFVLHRIPSASHPILDLIFLYFLFLQKQKKTWLFGFGENVYGWTLGSIGQYCHRWYSTHYIFIPPFSIWISTCAGVLVVNVTWRGKTYVGTLLDCTRHTNQWSAPRFVIVNLTKATIAITSQMIP